MHGDGRGLAVVEPHAEQSQGGAHGGERGLCVVGLPIV